MRHTVAAALLGQVLAVLIALTATCSASLAQSGVSAPTLQSALNYALLALVFTAVRVNRARGSWRLKCRWWAYALLALLDVEANYVIVTAFRFTSLTSVTLLDSFTIPVAVLLSRLLLGAAYRRGHYGGAALCIAGLAVLVVSDRSGASAGPAPLLGDGLVLLGAVLYALSNVLQEWLLGDVPAPELLAMLGCWGTLWSLAQGLPLELGTLRAAAWGAHLLLPFLGFATAMFAFYSLVPLELMWGGAALLNISLLASDLWAALARLLFFGGFAGNSLLFFCLSLLIVAAGIALFTWSGDVETALLAGSAAGAPSLPVAYHRVSTSAAEAQFHHPRRPLGSLSSGAGGKGAGREGRAALEELQRQQAQQAQQPAGPDTAAAAAAAAAQRGPAANPFDLAGLPSSLPGLRSGGRSPSGLSPMANADTASPSAELSTLRRPPAGAAPPSPRAQTGEAPALGAAALGGTDVDSGAAAADAVEQTSLEVAGER